MTTSIPAEVMTASKICLGSSSYLCLPICRRFRSRSTVLFQGSWGYHNTTTIASCHIDKDIRPVGVETDIIQCQGSSDIYNIKTRLRMGKHAFQPSNPLASSILLVIKTLSTPLVMERCAEAPECVQGHTEQPGRQ